MKFVTRSLLICATFAALASAPMMSNAQAVPQLAKDKNCMACHAVGNKVVGPAFKDVAVKFAGQKGSEDLLVGKVMKGSSGNWGAIPMPANPQVSEADARTLVKWILSLDSKDVPKAAKK